MAEYIQREALIKRLWVTPILKYGIPTYTRDGVIDLVEKQPAADVAPVVHSHWVHDSNNLYGCYRCGERETMSPKKLKKFCHECGARMDGAE